MLDRPDDQYEKLKPPHIATTVRSLPRRHREVLAGLPREAEVIGRRVDGSSALGLLVDTVRTLALIDRALELTLVRDQPVVMEAAVRAEARVWPEADPSAVDALLDELADIAQSLAERIDRAPSASWSRTATLAGGAGSCSAIELAREAARTGAENLRRLEHITAQLG